MMTLVYRYETLQRFLINVIILKIVPNSFRIRISNVLKKAYIPPIRKVNQPASFKDSCSYNFLSEHLVN